MLDGDLVCKCVVVNMYLGTPVCDKEKPAAFYVEDLEGAPCALLLGSHGDGILLILFPLCVKCGTETPAKIETGVLDALFLQERSLFHAQGGRMSCVALLVYRSSGFFFMGT